MNRRQFIQRASGLVAVCGMPLRPACAWYAGGQEYMGFNAAETFVGLLDLAPNALAAYSFRKLSAVYAGSAVSIRRASDSALADIGFDGQGNFDTAAAAVHIGASTGHIATWYDQSGNGYDVTQATAGNQPVYRSSGIGSRADMTLTAASQQFLLSGSNAIAFEAATLSAFAVVTFDTSMDAWARVVSMLASGSVDDYAGVDNAAVIERNLTNSTIIAMYNSTIRSTTTVVDEQSLVIGSIFDGTNHTIYEDGTASSAVATSTTGLGHASGNTLSLFAGQESGGDRHWQGAGAEVVIWPTSQTANVTVIDGNMGTYYGL